MSSKYTVTIKFSGGDEVVTTVKAHRKSYVLDLAKKTEEYKSFIEKHEGEYITETEIKPVIYRPEDRNFYLTCVSKKYCYVDHISAGVRVEFRRGQYNKGQSVWSLTGRETPDPEVAEKAIIDVGKWLSEFFPDVLVQRNTLPYDIIDAPNTKGKVGCHFNLREDTVSRIKEQAREHDMGIGEYIDWLFLEGRKTEETMDE